MRYQMPHYPCDFEIPDDWLSAAGMIGFVAADSAYRSTAAAILIPLAAIEPVYRFTAHPKDWRGFDRARLISIFEGFVAGSEIEPVPLLELPDMDFRRAPYRYRVLNGFHRFYASIAAGFDHLPGLP
jgi:hypothetical protein